MELFQTLTAVCFCFLLLLGLAPLTYSLHIYKQFKGETAQPAVANVHVSNTINLQVNLRFKKSATGTGNAVRFVKTTQLFIVRVLC